MSTTTTTEPRHLALPSEEELAEAGAAVDAAISALGEIRWRLNHFFALEERPRPDGKGGMAFTKEDGNFDTFDVPTLEDIGRLFIFCRDINNRLMEIDEYLEGWKTPYGESVSMTEVVEWLDVVRTAGKDGVVVSGSGGDDA